MPHYTLPFLAHLMEVSAPHAIPVTGVCVDSRLLQRGDLFFALKGERVDGHDYLSEVASKGAVAAVVSRSYQGHVEGLPLIPVDNVLATLQRATKNLLAARRHRLVAVTGSVGKTTTKDFIAKLASYKFLVASSPGNSNSQIGLPLAVFNHTTGEEEVLILEMGMTEAGHLSQMVQIAPPDIAIITTTALVHACYFEDLAAIGRAKAEIFSHPKTKLGILHRGIVNFDELVNTGSCRKLSFALQCPQADYSADVIDNKIVMTTPEGTQVMNTLPVIGRHNIHNFLGAAVVAHALGLSWEEINAAIPTLQLPERRLQMIQRDGVIFINDSYNATVVSIKAALEVLPEPTPGGKRIAVLGRIVDLGKFSDECHREVGECALKHVDTVLCYGQEARPILDVWQAAGRQAEWHPERAGVVEALRKILCKGDVVLLKGSRDKAVWKVLEEL